MENKRKMTFRTTRFEYSAPKPEQKPVPENPEQEKTVKQNRSEMETVISANPQPETPQPEPKPVMQVDPNLEKTMVSGAEDPEENIEITQESEQIAEILLSGSRALIPDKPGYNAAFIKAVATYIDKNDLPFDLATSTPLERNKFIHGFSEFMRDFDRFDK